MLLFRVTKIRLLLFIISTLAVLSSSAQDQSIYALRSAYLYYFAHFIQWPRSTEFKNGELALCAITSDSQDQFQLYTIDNKPLGDVRLHVSVFLSPAHYLRTEGEVCQILYVSEEYESWFADMEPLGGNVLLVNEGDARGHGHIRLFQKESKLKFEIHADRVKQNGFKVSSKLMRLSSSGWGR